MTPRRRNPLTREQIVDTALQIVDEEGLEALSMRRLGAALGVEAMALYRHVPNKEALLDLTLERMRSEVRIEESHPDNPAELLAAIFLEYRRVLAAHPNMLPIAARRTDSGTPSGLDFLVSEGFDLEDAVELYQSLLAFTIGFSLLGNEASAGNWEGTSQEISSRFGDWKDSTFRRTLRSVVESYGFDKGDRRL